MTKIRKGDKVQVMRGKDAGKISEVLAVKEVVKANGVVKTVVTVKDVNIVKKAQKPNPQLRIPGGINQFEKAIDVSNVMFYDEKAKKPSRVGFKVDEKTGKKVRYSKKSGELI